MRPPPSNTKNCFNNKGIKHITRLRPGLSHFRYHKFKHGFFILLIEATCHFYTITPTLDMNDQFSWTLFQQQTNNYLWRHYCQTSHSWW